MVTFGICLLVQTLKFNDQAIGLLIDAAAGKAREISPMEAKGKRFSIVRTVPNAVTFLTEEKGKPMVSGMPFCYSNKKDQFDFRDSLIKKLSGAFKHYRVEERNFEKVKDTDQVRREYFALVDVVDGAVSRWNSITIIVDFQTGVIVSGSASFLFKNITLGSHINEKKIKAILDKRAIRDFKISKAWLPFNFVVPSRASDAHDRDLALSTSIEYIEGGKTKFSIINDLGDFLQSPDLTQFSIERSKKKIVPPKP